MSYLVLVNLVSSVVFPRLCPYKCRFALGEDARAYKNSGTTKRLVRQSSDLWVLHWGWKRPILDDWPPQRMSTSYLWLSIPEACGENKIESGSKFGRDSCTAGSWSLYYAWLANKAVPAKSHRWPILMGRIFVLVEVLSSPGTLQSQLLSSIKPPNRDRYESSQAAISAKGFRRVL